MFVITILFAALVKAYTTPTTQCTDSCNPISAPGLNQVVTAGKAFTITWDPTTAGTVSIVLYKGASTNLQSLYAIASDVSNSGTYSWTPSTDLEPSGNSGYGIQLINDSDGTYQWSTQFGISNSDYSSSSTSPSSTTGTGMTSASTPTQSSNHLATSSTFLTSSPSSSITPTSSMSTTGTSTTSGATASNTSSQKSSSSTASSFTFKPWMAGAIGGGVGALVLVAALTWCLKRRAKQQKGRYEQIGLVSAQVTSTSVPQRRAMFAD